MIFKLTLFFAVAACSWLVASATQYSGVIADVSDLPPSMREVGDLLSSRVVERLGRAPDAAAFTVRYQLDHSVAGDNAFVSVSGGVAVVRAARYRGLLAGSGNLLKSFRYGEGRVEVTPGRFDFIPLRALRACYCARHFRNWYMEAPAPELCRYIEDLALDGYNAFKFQFAMPAVDAANESLATTECFERASRELFRRIETLDCQVCQFGGSNQLPQDSPERYRAVPNTDPKRPSTGFNACPHKPGAEKALMDLRSDELRKTAGLKVGAFCYWPYDEGGCGCRFCSPWGGNGYLKLIEKFNKLNEKAHPGALNIVSAWFFDEDDYAGLWRYLEGRDWVDYVLVDDFGPEFPRYPLEHPLPGRTKLITFPEISMWGRVPWGGFGAIAYPEFLLRLFRQSESVADGFMCYSEGCYEDINKAIAVGLYVSPSVGLNELLERYVSYHFPGARVSDGVRLVRFLEKNHRPHLMRREDVFEALRIARKMNSEILPTMRQSWRWRLVYLRTLADHAIVTTGSLRPTCAKPFFDEMVKIYHAERQLQLVKDGLSGGWTCPRYAPSDILLKPLMPTGCDDAEKVESLINNPQRVALRLGKGDWNIRALRVTRSRFTLTADDGCRLGSPIVVGSCANGITIASGGNRVIVEEGARNVVVDGCRFGVRSTEEFDAKEGESLRARISRVDSSLEWSEQHLAYEEAEVIEDLLRRLLDVSEAIEKAERGR